MNTRIKNNIPQTANNLWNFVNDFEVGNISDMQIDMPEASAIHEIVKACEFIVQNKSELYKILNNTKE
jgi:hypothetical protein